MKAYRIKDGFLCVWESYEYGGDFFIREIRYKKLPLKSNGEVIGIEDFAERLIQKLNGDEDE